jgi:hypothetical protein
LTKTAPTERVRQSERVLTTCAISMKYLSQLSLLLTAFLAVFAVLTILL